MASFCTSVRGRSLLDLWSWILCLELIGVPPGEVDVLPPVLDTVEDARSFSDLVPRLDGEELASRGEGLLHILDVVLSSTAIGHQATRPTEVGVVEARTDLGHGEAGIGIESRRSRAPVVEAVGMDGLVRWR